MSNTPNYNLILSGMPQFIEDDNDNFTLLDAVVAGAGVHPVAISEIGNTHDVQFTGNFELLKFTAMADFAVGDILSVNGIAMPVTNAEGNPYTYDAWKAGDTVILACRADGVRVLVPERQKANKGTVSEILPLTFGAGYTGQGQISKDELGTVHLWGSFQKNTTPLAGEVVCYLPDGYTPVNTGFSLPMVVTQGYIGTNGSPWHSFVWINGSNVTMNGYVRNNGSFAANSNTVFSGTYKAAKV